MRRRKYTRMGVDKATLSHRGRAPGSGLPTLEPQVGQLVISASALNSAQLCTHALHYRLPNRLRPLSRNGASALASPAWLEYDWLVFSSCDTPQQPVDWVSVLLEASGGNAGIYYIRHQGQPHYLHALWHRNLLAPLSKYLQQGGRAVRAFYAQNQALPVDYAAAKPNQPDPFINLNTPEGL